jgi:hypothetical protein
MIAKGSFEVVMQPEPPYESSDGITLARVSIDKRFTGPLEATGKVQMLAARTPVETSAGYVAMERIDGTLDGRRGAFVVAHVGLMARGARSLSIQIVPDSGSGELTGIAGKMDIQLVNGKHFYEIDYTFDR